MWYEIYVFDVESEGCGWVLECRTNDKSIAQRALIIAVKKYGEENVDIVHI